MRGVFVPRCGTMASGIEIETMTRLIVYSRTYCHLCDDLVRALAPWRERYAFELRVVDIEDEPELEMRYGARVPVVCADDGVELCHYTLDDAALCAYLERGRK